jgi:mono/diheme cytochrome c family protein
MTRALLLLAVEVVASAQNLPDVLKQGEKVFSGTCSTGYCHGVRATAAGAPRLVGPRL